jgi:hypothetical protein
MANPKVGATYRYRHELGLGDAASGPDVDLAQVPVTPGVPDGPAMSELDMQPGTTVVVCGHDEDRDLVLVEWTDMQGNPRTTSVEQAAFAEHFVKG